MFDKTKLIIGFNTFIALLYLALSLLDIFPLNAAIETDSPRRKLKIAVLCEDFWSNIENAELYNPFFSQVNRLIQKAGSSLDVEIKIVSTPLIYSELRSFLMEFSDRYSPDGFLCAGGGAATLNILKIAEELRIPTVTYNSTVPGSEGKAGAPRERYKYWVGEIVPDDQYVGYLLAKELVRRARLKGINRISMVAFAGTFHDYGSIERIKGLRKAVSEMPGIELKQIFSTGGYDYDVSRDKFRSVKETRYPEANVFWCACDNIAFGVIDEAREMGLVPGRDVITGGVDWLSSAFDRILSGEMELSIGGHYMEGAYALVMLYDYLNGSDFARYGVSLYSEKMKAVDQSNALYYKQALSEENQDVYDFKRFSRIHNPGMGRYAFSVDRLIQK